MPLSLSDPSARNAGAVEPMLDRSVVRHAMQCLLLLVALNTCFLAIRLADVMIAKPVVASALLAGYSDGSMTIESYPTNMLVGRDQYSDCIASQIAVLGGDDILRDAIAPRLLAEEQVGVDGRASRHRACLDLKRYLESDRKPLPHATYTRFWQGAASVLAFALTILPVDGYRALLLDLTLGLIALTAIMAALAGRDILLSLAPVLAASFLWDGQIGYGQLFSYGPPQIALWSIIASMVAWRARLTYQHLLLLSVVAGGSEAFFDQIISVPLAATLYLVVAGLLHAWHKPAINARSMATVMASLSAAWLFGFAGSYIAKLFLSIALLGRAPLADFVNQLAFRAGSTDPEFGYTASAHASRLVMLAEIFITLVSNSWRLGFTSGRSGPFGCFVLTAVGFAGWLIALLRLVQVPRSQRNAFFVAGAPYIAALLFLLLWIMALPEHTLRHAFFIVRSTLILTAGGWGWLAAVRYAPGIQHRREPKHDVNRESAVAPREVSRDAGQSGMNA